MYFNYLTILVGFARATLAAPAPNPAPGKCEINRLMPKLQNDLSGYIGPEMVRRGDEAQNNNQNNNWGPGWGGG
jgi:hypothetical protein